MNAISFSYARNNFKHVLDEVIEDYTTTIITRRDSEDAVIMSLDSFNSIMETLHLLKSPANAEYLKESIAQLESGHVVEKELFND